LLAVRNHWAFNCVIIGHKLPQNLLYKYWGEIFHPIEEQLVQFRDLDSGLVHVEDLFVLVKSNVLSTALYLDGISLSYEILGLIYNRSQADLGNCHSTDIGEREEHSEHLTKEPLGGVASLWVDKVIVNGQHGKSELVVEQ
jgi:hypothetical protein